MSVVVCIGSVLIDELYFCQKMAVAGTSNPATFSKSAGGVMSNIVRNLSLLDVETEFITVTGTDNDAEYLNTSFENSGISTRHFIKVNESTGKYVSVLNSDGSLFAAVCSDKCSAYITPELLQKKSSVLLDARIIIADTNLETEALNWLIRFSNEKEKILIIEPVSTLKSSRLSTLDLNGIYLLTPNENEIFALTDNQYDNEQDMVNELLRRGVKNVWISKGNQGSTFYHGNGLFHLSVPEVEIKDSTGAGDASVAGWVAGYLDQQTIENCMMLGHCMAIETLNVTGSLNFDINRKKIIALKEKYYHE